MVVQEIPAIRDFTIRDPCYFVILFQVPILWIPHQIMKNKCKKKSSEFFSENFRFLYFLLHILMFH